MAALEHHHEAFIEICIQPQRRIHPTFTVQNLTLQRLKICVKPCDHPVKQPCRPTENSPKPRTIKETNPASPKVSKSYMRPPKNRQAPEPQTPNPSKSTPTIREREAGHGGSSAALEGAKLLEEGLGFRRP